MGQIIYSNIENLVLWARILYLMGHKFLILSDVNFYGWNGFEAEYRLVQTDRFPDKVLGNRFCNPPQAGLDRLYLSGIRI
jgi:hypothetical protein